MMKIPFILLFLFTSVFASEDIVNHIHSEHFWEFLLSILFSIIFIFVIGHYILKKKNNQLEAKVAEVIYDLEKAQSVAKIGSWVYDLKNNKLRWSKEIYSMFEVDIGDDNLYEKFINRVHPDDRETLEEAYRLSLKNQTGYSLEHRLLMDDGSIKYVLENCVSSFEEDGIPKVSRGTVQDITEATLIKIELKEKDAYMFQQARLAQMGEMLSMIAHQWRQPLAAISSNNISIKTVLELEVYNLKDDKEQKDFLNFVYGSLHKTTTYLQNLSNTITNFSNFYKPNREFTSENVDAVILKAYNLVADSLSSEEIEVEFKLESNNEFMMHENEFMQVILNIIYNAKDQLIQNSIENPIIRIDSSFINNELCINIADNAGGIGEENIDKIFDPYYSTKLEKNGTGLGLYMSKIIIKDYHGGDIYAKNSNNGAIFTIRIKKVQGKNDEL